MKRVSPAAAAGISRVLANAGVTRSAEIVRGLETEGYYASPGSDHVRVEYVPSAFGPVDAQRVAAGLSRCQEILTAKGYEVERVVVPIAVPGGWEDGEVLTVRKR